jgi:putative flippase GtrA
MQTIQQLRASTPKETKRFVKFLIVGAFGFLVDFGSFNLMHRFAFGSSLAPNLPFAVYFMEHPEVIEQTCSFTLATISNFLWNYFWIYPEARGANQANKMSKFIIVSVAGLFIGVPVFTVALLVFKPLIANLGLEDGPFNLAGNLALMTRVGILLFWNFFINRKWTYGDVPAK